MPQDADELLAVGGNLAPETLLQAYSNGAFPMPLPVDLHSSDGAYEPIGWWSPDPRGVLELDGLQISRSLRRSLTRYEIRMNTAFEQVINACADPARPHSWIDADFIAAYCKMHQLGHAHSVETWHDDKLVGGLYGVAIGGFFAGESMFHHQRDASKAALVGLVTQLKRCGFTLLDVQWLTDHLQSLGATEMPRLQYLARLETAITSKARPFSSPD